MGAELSGLTAAAEKPVPRVSCDRASQEIDDCDRAPPPRCVTPPRTPPRAAFEDVEIKRPPRQRPARAPSYLHRKRSEAKSFLRVSLRRWARSVGAWSLDAFRLRGYARNRRRIKGQHWEAPFFWDVGDWKSVRERPFRAKVVGPAFERGGHSFNIDLYPGGFREDGKASVGAYLRYTGDRPCLELRLRLSVVDQRGGPDVAWRSGLALLGNRARLDQGIVTNWGSARLVPRVWLAAGSGHPGLVVDDCVRFRVDVMILGERRVDVNPLGGLARPLAREVVGAPITPVKRRSIVSPMKGRAR